MGVNIVPIVALVDFSRTATAMWRAFHISDSGHASDRRVG